MSYLSDIQLDDPNLPPPTPEIEQERKVAIFDLLEKNTFKLPEKANGKNSKGPFNLKLAIKDKRLVFDLNDQIPILTTKKMFVRGIFEELSWFLRGQTDSKILENNQVNIQYYQNHSKKLRFFSRIEE